MVKLLIMITGLLLIGLLIWFNWFNLVRPNQSSLISPNAEVPEVTPTSNKIITPESPINIPEQKLLVSNYHIYQSFNNCGPAAFSMALHYYGISKTQQELGIELRPYQNPQGDNDDKSVTLSELANKAADYQLLAYHRPAGTDDDIGHYRVIKGYDRVSQQLIQDDSLQGKNLSYSYQDFNILWSKYNYEFLVLVPASKKSQVQAILADKADETSAWKVAATQSAQLLKENPDDLTAVFNLSVASYHLKDYAASARYFSLIEDRLSFRTLWYQIEPILALYELGEYQRVFQITDQILNNHNRAFSELYLIRGNIYKQQGKISEAKSEFEKAVKYNKHSVIAQQAYNETN